MIENIKIALKKQKKLIALFLLTIVLPSLILSVFGIRAIRNEKFRLEKKIEIEHRRIAEFLKTQIYSRFENIELVLTNTAQYPSFLEKDYPAIKELLDKQIVDNPLIEQIFMLYRDENPIFPQIQPVTRRHRPASRPLLDDSQQKLLMKAQEHEFQQKDYRAAVTLYRELLLSGERIDQAQVLNFLARNLKKLGMYRQAITHYLRIADDFSDHRSSSRRPLGLIAELQIVDCYQRLGDFQNAINRGIQLYGNLLGNSWNLDEDQFSTYTSMVKENIADLLNQNEMGGPGREYQDEFEQMNKQHQGKMEQWQIHNSIREEIIPDLTERFLQAESDIQLPFRLSKTIDNQDFLIFTGMIPDEAGRKPLGILGIKMNNDYLTNVVLDEIIDEFQSDEEAIINVSDFAGQRLYGDVGSEAKSLSITEYFDDNFPPWKIEIYDISKGSSEFIGIHKSFYFWTILTLIVILIFGAVLIMMTIAHEREILKIKSDFVSSVSHELKTPLTSIKALTERLLEGKVKSQAKMRQYFSVISQDTDKLTRLVKNVLDFSRIEEGKKEYDFKETDIASWTKQTVDDYLNDRMQEDIKVRVKVEGELPPLHIDRDALSRSLGNLLDNALKFSPEKKEVEIRVRGDDNNVILQVKDTGIGIPQDELGRIFEKFYQGSNALRQSVKGTGLGLTLVKHAVEAHQGKIEVESKTDQGTTFSLIFPVKGIA